jgi:Beta-glucosidase-related glycosidases
MTSAGKKGKPFSIVRDLVNDGVTGGVLFLGGSSGKLSQRINELKDVVTSSGNLHLLISSDAEPSLINRRISGISQFKNTNEIHSVIEAYKIGSKIAGEIKAIGFNYNFAPVCDFPFNREIIGNRSFGGDIDSIPKFVSAFIKGTQENNIIATAKHFPGHGNITGDSHKQLVTISGEMKELEVFRSAIDAGVISVMVGHIRVSDNDYSTDGLPSTLSKRIVSDLLRDSLEFRGIIVTDAMNMGALREFPNASLEAVRAGCDLIIMPPDERKLHSQIIELISSDENYKQQVFASVKRILRAKICLGLI